MTWTMTYCHFDLTPEEVEEMEIRLEILKDLQERPESFLLLFQPRFANFSWFSDVLFEKLCKLVKKEAMKEGSQIEAQLQQQKADTGTQPAPQGGVQK